MRFQSTQGGGPGVGGGRPRPPPPPPSSVVLPKTLGMVHITAKNVQEEVKQGTTPLILFFHIRSHPEVLTFTLTLQQQVELANKEAAASAAVSANAGGSTPPAATGAAANLAVRLGLVDCETEMPLAQQFGVRGDQFPLMFFIVGGNIVDRLVGMVPEAQIRDAITAFIKFGKEETEAAASGTPTSASSGGDDPAGASSDATASPLHKVPRMDNDEENVMTLLQAATKKLKDKDKDAVKAEQLFRKAHAVGEAAIEKLKKELGLHLKKATPQVMDRLKQDPHYHACPQALSGVALSLFAQNKHEECYATCKVIREQYPWATKELREVAEAVCKLELLRAADYDPDKDSYVNLMRNDQALNEPVKFYTNNVKLAVAHFMERQPQLAIDECLKLLRAEPKLLADLKRAGVVPEDVRCNGVSTDEKTTPARKVLSLLLESLGSNNEIAIRARKKMAAFL